MGNYKCPWCGSVDTSRHTYSYATHAVKGLLAFGGAVAGELLGRATGTPGPGPHAQKAAENWLKKGSYDCKCNKCGKDFYVCYDETKNEIRIRKRPKGIPE